MSNLLQAYNDLKEPELINEMAITETGWNSMLIGLFNIQTRTLSSRIGLSPSIKNLPLFQWVRPPDSGSWCWLGPCWSSWRSSCPWLPAMQVWKRRALHTSAWWCMSGPGHTSHTEGPGRPRRLHRSVSPYSGLWTPRIPATGRKQESLSIIICWKGNDKLKEWGILTPEKLWQCKFCVSKTRA